MIVPGRTQRQCRTRWMQIYKDLEETNVDATLDLAESGIGGELLAESFLKEESVVERPKTPPSEFEDDSDAYDSDHNVY